MIQQLSIFIVGAAGLYLVVLGFSALVAPDRTARFLLGFASTPTHHFLEILCRVVIGASLIIAAPGLYPAQPFALFGWLLVVTSGLMLVVPWRWHQRFARTTVPVANRYIGLIGIASLIGGALVLMAVLRGLAT